ncbi:MAG: glycosyltransferase family 2 protein [bacterium]|nr:glycosyltransferase family 2 protein [bacterium]
MSADAFRPIWVVPCYRHESSLRKFLPQLVATGIPILVVDDGNDEPLAPFEGADFIRSEKNEGKGAALVRGAHWATKRGYTHLVQIDADGQHSVSDALTMIAVAEKEPNVFISGFPIYDASAPMTRAKGREITRFFLWLETGLKGEDGLCGCRVYPLQQFLQVCQRVRTRRMGFDVEVIVKWIWQGYRIKQHHIHVTYPLDGISNFRMLRDNVGFFALHTRLCCLRILRFFYKRSLTKDLAIDLANSK